MTNKQKNDPADKLLTLNPITLAAQRAARADVKRDSIILLALVAAGVLIQLALIYYGFANVLWIIIFLGILYLISNWRQWRAYTKHELHCPYCTKPLTNGIQLLKRPGPYCPHCGEIALATGRQLENQKT